MGTRSNTKKITISNLYPDPSGGQYAFKPDVITIPDGVYVSGQHTVTWTARIHFKANASATQKIQIYLAASSTPSSEDILISEHTFTTLAAGYYAFNVTGKTFSGENRNFTNKSLGIRLSKSTSGLSVSNMPIDMEIAAGGLTLTTTTGENTITCSALPSGTGSLTANKATAAQGTTVTLTPSPKSGYKLDSYTTVPANLKITSNKFTMPDQAVTVTANYVKIPYALTRKSSPAEGGTVYTKVNGQNVTTATMGTTVNVSQAPYSGYVFKEFTTSPAVTINSSGNFTMPASAVTITGKYQKISTATLNKSTLTGGGSVIMNITPGSSAYTHQYKLEFTQSGSVIATTGWVDITAGTTSLSITVPLNWSAQIPSAESMAGGTMYLRSKNGSTVIGDYTITGLTYAVPAEAVPEIGTITAEIARTIGGVTYASIGDYYVQNHCGVRVQATASGTQGASVIGLSVAISGYSGTSYRHTTTSGSMDFTTGLLSIAGETTITVTATDSRGRTASATERITVQAYSNPSGSLEAKRVDAQGADSDTGGYGAYSLTTQYTQLGTNTLNWSLQLKYGSTVIATASSPAASGDILPGNKLALDTTKEYTLELILQDALETAVITARIPSAKFIIYVESGGDRMAFMGVAKQTIPTGKNSTIEFPADGQIYIGNDTLEEYIDDRIPTPPTPPVVPELQTKTVSGSTNSNGNISLGSDIPQECVLTLDITGTYLAIPFYSNGWYARVLNRSTMAVATETSVTIKAYYMY